MVLVMEGPGGGWGVAALTAAKVFPLYFISCENHYTVTRIEVIFRYPDQVPLTHFVHRAKKVFSM
jgi:hypothetical protein